jgi:hypothetical protein
MCVLCRSCSGTRRCRRRRSTRSSRSTRCAMSTKPRIQGRAEAMRKGAFAPFLRRQRRCPSGALELWAKAISGLRCDASADARLARWSYGRRPFLAFAATPAPMPVSGIGLHVSGRIRPSGHIPPVRHTHTSGMKDGFSKRRGKVRNWRLKHPIFLYFGGWPRVLGTGRTFSDGDHAFSDWAARGRRMSWRDTADRCSDRDGFRHFDGAPNTRPRAVTCPVQLLNDVDR